MLDREIEEENLPFALRHSMAMLAYSPLALGLPSGKVTAQRKFVGDDLRAGHPRFSAESLPKVDKMLAAVEPIARSRGTIIAQIVIAWTIARPGLTHALVGARNRSQALENAAADEIALSDSELLLIGRAVEQHAAAAGA